MPPSAAPSLSLSEWLVLCLVCSGPARVRHLPAARRERHTRASLAGAQARRLPLAAAARAVGFRADGRRGDLHRGPGPVAGRRDPGRPEAASAWLAGPASRPAHAIELLAKLALLDRAGTDPRPLLDAQREQLVPVAAALQERLAEAEVIERTIAAWRWENCVGHAAVPRRTHRPAGRLRGRSGRPRPCARPTLRSLIGTTDRCCGFLGGSGSASGRTATMPGRCHDRDPRPQCGAISRLPSPAVDQRAVVDSASGRRSTPRTRRPGRPSPGSPKGTPRTSTGPSGPPAVPSTRARGAG